MLPTIATDYERWIGFSNDPAEVNGWCFWVRLGHWKEIYVQPDGILVTPGLR